MPFYWIELAPPASLTPGQLIDVNGTCANITLANQVTFYQKNYTMATLSKQGFIGFPNGGPALCVDPSIDAKRLPPCPFPIQAFGTGIALFTGYTTQLAGSGAAVYYRYFPTPCPYAGLSYEGCHVIQYNNSRWNGFIFTTFAVTAEAILGDDGVVILQYLDVNTLYWLGAQIGVQTIDGHDTAASYPESYSFIDASCPTANVSNPLFLAGMAICFYEEFTPIPCDSVYNITFSNSSLAGCTCPDFDHDGYVCPDHDACPFDPNKHLSPGVCGCGVPDIDTDGDGYDNCIDACPLDPHKWLSPGLCGCGHPDYLPGTYTLACAASSLSSWFSLVSDLL